MTSFGARQVAFEAAGTMGALIQERADAYMRHCVAGVTKGGKGKAAAFAICKAGGNKAGYYEPGTKTKTAKGKKAIRAHARDKAARGKDAAYDRAIKSEATMGSMSQVIGRLEEGSGAAKAAEISRRIMALRAQGKSVKDAIDAVLGAGAYDKLASDLYDELRAKAAKGKP
jgi:hypothetical protein